MAHSAQGYCGRTSHIKASLPRQATEHPEDAEPLLQVSDVMLVLRGPAIAYMLEVHTSHERPPTCSPLPSGSRTESALQRLLGLLKLLPFCFRPERTPVGYASSLLLAHTKSLHSQA